MNRNTEYKREIKRVGIVPILDDKAMPMKRVNPKINRNISCPCGSGLKYKKCCLNNK
jgi:uncharacterized protein YecA (UPF0149 family)